MCSLCAALGGSRNWTDAAGQAAFAKTGRNVTLRDERSRRVALLNAVLVRYKLTISDWGGNSYVLSDAAGRTANMYTLGGIWSDADRLASEPCDPLDPDLIANLNASAGGSR
jgi:hypothetical protein